ncbi:MAG: YceD family protein [Euzebya sp.]
MSNDQHELHPTRVVCSDLIDSPGATRAVELDVSFPSDFDVPLTTFGDVVQVDGVLEALVEGILLRGTVSVDASQHCARCLEPIPTGRLSVQASELYTDPAQAERPDDVEQGFEISGQAIDIEALVRDALARATSADPRCRPDCAGLCPTCGVNLNDTSCDCHDVIVDDRWAALTNLKINP